MKYSNLILFFISLLFIEACSKDEKIITSDSRRVITYNMEDYYLLDSNLFCIPYLGKKQVAFINESGEKMRFTIEEAELKLVSTSLRRYNKQGDTLIYNFKSQRKFIHLLRNDSTDFTFNLEITAQPDIQKPDLKGTADVLTIFYHNDEIELRTGYSVFTKNINARLHSHIYDFNTRYPAFEAWDRVFRDVERSGYTNPKSIVYYNYTEGIVAFTDHENKLWRFDSME